LPVAGEMISLPNQGKKDAQSLQDGLCLHYFPNIPLDPPSNHRRRDARDSGFQRSLFNGTDSARSGDQPADQLPETSVEPKVPSVDKIKENAFQKGFVEGKKVGFESGTKKADPVINSLNRIIEQLENVNKVIQQEIEKEVVQLALSIAKKIVCHEVKTTQETVVCVAREALGRVENPGKINIKLNPDDLQFIEDTKSQLSQFLHNADHIRFEAEESIQSGGCLIETDRGDIDARIEKQFQAIEESFQSQFEAPKQENE
jgi:flagellar biosynthesis/type III secretory pathway protein FliH